MLTRIAISFFTQIFNILYTIPPTMPRQGRAHRARGGGLVNRVGQLLCRWVLLGPELERVVSPLTAQPLSTIRGWFGVDSSFGGVFLVVS